MSCASCEHNLTRPPSSILFYDLFSIAQHGAFDLVLPYASGDLDAAAAMECTRHATHLGNVVVAHAPQRIAVALWRGLNPGRVERPAEEAPRPSWMACATSLSPFGQNARERRAADVLVWLRNVCDISDGLCTLVADALLPAGVVEAADAAASARDDPLAYLEAMRYAPAISTLLDADTVRILFFLFLFILSKSRAACRCFVCAVNCAR